jgi:hypothetical protein
MDTEGLFCWMDTGRMSIFINLMHEATASENREETATTGIELNQIEKHGANLCLFDREIQIQCRLFDFHLK